jgi:hypothetical protein
MPGPLRGCSRATARSSTTRRHDRERRVSTAVHEGAADVDAVVDAAYDKDLTGFEELARATVVAHLEKLDVEGRVVFDREVETVAPA